MAEIIIRTETDEGLANILELLLNSDLIDLCGCEEGVALPVAETPAVTAVNAVPDNTEDKQAEPVATEAPVVAVETPAASAVETPAVATEAPVAVEAPVTTTP